MTMTNTVHRLAWITGASSGIGAALAIRLADTGWQVAVPARNTEALQAMAARNGNIHPFALDVTELDAVHHTVAAIQARLGPIDVALLNAGDYQPMALDEFDPALFERLMRVNYLGVVYGLDALRRSMCSRGARDRS